MQTEVLLAFLQGATAMGCVALAACFIRFYRRSRERLFLLFALGFAVFAVGRVFMVFLDSPYEAELAAYGIRAAAFALILVAIVDKNRSAGA